MDVVFLIPATPEIELDWYDSSFKVGLDMVPLGVFYMATILENDGYNVEVIDFGTIHDKLGRDLQLANILSRKPRVIGISTTTPTYPVGKEIARRIRKELGHSCLIVWGGYHVTFLPEEPLLEDLADVVVKGEGELAMLEISRCFLEKVGNLKSIEGIVYKTNGKIVNNPPALLRINKLDNLPFPKRDFINHEKYRNPATIIASRGCIAKCQFCAAGAFGLPAMRSPENVVNEVIKLQDRYKFSHLFFVDNTFTTNKPRTLKILQLMKDEKIKISFSIESRVSQINEEYIKQLAEHSLIAVQFGVETGNQQIMHDIGKKITLKQVELMVELCLKYGIIVTLSFIIGHPFDTKETVLQTIEFAKNLVKRGAHATFGILTPFPGTEVFFNREKLGVEIFEWDFSRWSVNKPVMRTKYLSQRELKTLMATASSEINSLY